jgi:hypothetical protein
MRFYVSFSFSFLLLLHSCRLAAQFQKNKRLRAGLVLDFHLGLMGRIEQKIMSVTATLPPIVFLLIVGNSRRLLPKSSSPPRTRYLN